LKLKPSTRETDRSQHAACTCILGCRACSSAKGTVHLSGVHTVELHIPRVTCIDYLLFVVYKLQCKKSLFSVPNIGFLYVIINYNMLQTTGIVETLTRKT
jgi:hypothetical protein